MILGIDFRLTKGSTVIDASVCDWLGCASIGKEVEFNKESLMFEDDELMECIEMFVLNVGVACNIKVYGVNILGIEMLLGDIMSSPCNKTNCIFISKE